MFACCINFIILQYIIAFIAFKLTMPCVVLTHWLRDHSTKQTVCNNSTDLSSSVGLFLELYQIFYSGSNRTFKKTD